MLFGCEGRGPFEHAAGLGELLQLHVRQAEVVVRRVVVGKQPERHAVLRDGLRPAIEQPVDACAIEAVAPLVAGSRSTPHRVRTSASARAPDARAPARDCFCDGASPGDADRRVLAARRLANSPRGKRRHRAGADLAPRAAQRCRRSRPDGCGAGGESLAGSKHARGRRRIGPRRGNREHARHADRQQRAHHGHDDDDGPDGPTRGSIDACGDAGVSRDAAPADAGSAATRPGASGCMPGQSSVRRASLDLPPRQDPDARLTDAVVEVVRVAEHLDRSARREHQVLIDDEWRRRADTCRREHFLAVGATSIRRPSCPCRRSTRPCSGCRRRWCRRPARR